VASDDLRDALFVLYLTSAHLRIIIPSSGEWTLIITMIGSACNTNFRNCLQRHSRGILSKKFPPAAESSAS
nr:hypothetical protein [Tanacetum cinerariifolium]